MSLKILVIHGPNLNLLGSREKEIYGSVSLESINKELKQRAKEKGVALETFQSNHEGEIVDKIGEAQGKFDFILINPAAYTHTSIAIRDALLSVKIPVIEIHLSNVYQREEFRHKSMIASLAMGQICGFGANSYYLALDAACAAQTK